MAKKKGRRKRTRKGPPPPTAYKPNDWESWRKEHVSEVRTTKHVNFCNTCTRWMTVEGSDKPSRCRECNALKCRIYDKKNRIKLLDKRKERLRLRKERDG